MSFKYSVASTVKLNVPSNTPVVVKRHQHIPTKYVKHSNVHQVKSTVCTNELLKNGGTLPPVLPDAVDGKDGQISQRSSSHRAQRKKIIQPNNARKEKTYAVQDVKALQKTSKLEQERNCRPTCELSEVYLPDESEKRSPYEISNKESQCTELEETQEKFQVERIHSKFTVKNYIAMITEMNEYICLEPYDPAEFSISADINLQKSRDTKRALSEKTEITQQQNQKDVLSAIHEELTLWKNRTKSSEPGTV